MGAQHHAAYSQMNFCVLQATSSTPSGKIDHNAGYQYRRLTQHYTTGIYECNDGCSCRKTCLNRVAQRPMQLRLQAFKTEKRGWGIRCLDDRPRGGFICVYAGQLLTDQEANEDGKEAGDEYLAELDLIEVVEKGKDGYESDVDIDIDDPSNTSQGSSGKIAPKYVNVTVIKKNFADYRWGGFVIK